MSVVDSYLLKEDLLGENPPCEEVPGSAREEIPGSAREEVPVICLIEPSLSPEPALMEHSVDPVTGPLAAARDNPSPSCESNVQSSPPPKSSVSRPETPSKTSTKSPKRPMSCSPKMKRVFSPDDHKKHLSQFKQREAERKKSLEERRKKQAEELERKRQAILKKHQAADKRLQDKSKASPRKVGAFGSTVRSRSTMSLNLSSSERQHHTGSVQSLTSPQVQLRPRTSTPRLKRPLSMGAIPSNAPTTRSPVTPTTKGVTQPVIKQKKKDEKNVMKAKVDKFRNLMRPSKVPNYVPPAKRNAEPGQPKNNTKPTRTSSIGAKSPTTSGKQPNNKPNKPSSVPGNTLPRRRGSTGRLENKPATKSNTPESPSKSVMNSLTQAKVNQQEEAKLRLEEARKKAREERVIKEEEMRRLAEERRIEEERIAKEAEEARQRMLKDKELKKKQQEEETERARIAAAEKVEQDRLDLERRTKEEQERSEQQRGEQEAIQAVRRKADEERKAKEEEERSERQKKLDAILKRSSVKFEAAPKREISDKASAILAKHNITLNLPSKQDSFKSEDSENEEASKVEEVVDNDNKEYQPATESAESVELSEESTNANLGLTSSNNHTSLEGLLNGESTPEAESLIKLSDDKQEPGYGLIDNGPNLGKEAGEFTITTQEELQLSNVL